MTTKSDQKKNEEAFRRAAKAINLGFQKMRSNTELKKLAIDIRKQVVKRTRLGFGVKDNQQRYRFPKLSDTYIQMRAGRLRFFTNKGTGKVFAVQLGKQLKLGKVTRRAKTAISKSGKTKGVARAKKSTVKRKRVAAKNLSDQTSPRRSNVTATGFLLDNLIINAARGFAIVSPGTKKRTKDIFGDKIKKPASDRRIMKFLRDQGRTFMKLTIPEERKFLRETAKKIRIFANEFIKRGIA